MNNNHNAQRGMTGFGWLVVLALIAFFALLTLRLAPVYLDYYKVVSSLKSLKQEPNLTQKTPAEIMDLLSRRFDVNSINDVTRKDIHIEKSGGVLTVGVKYQVRVPIMGNVDALVSFNRSVHVVSH